MNQSAETTAAPAFEPGAAAALTGDQPAKWSLPPTPLQQSERIKIIDALRGVALLGILLMNMPYFSLPFITAGDLRIRNEVSGINYYTWWGVNLFFEGTMRAMFSILFGAGTILLINRLEAKHTGTYPADIYYRRIIWLLIFGLINAFIFLWPGDILYSYAICGLFLFPFRKLAPRYLLMFGIGLMLVLNLKNTLTLYESKNNRVKGEYAAALDKQKTKLTTEQKADKEKYEARIERLKPESLRKEAAKEVTAYRKGYFALMGHLKNINVKIQSAIFYNTSFYDALAFFFFGMALFKWGVLTGQRSVGFYAMMCIVGYGIGITLSYLIQRNTLDVNYDKSYLADKLFVDFYDEKRLFLCLGHISLLIFIFKTRVIDRAFKALASVGQMAFTNYLMQTLICGFIFYGYGLRWFDYFERHQIYYFVAGIWIFQIMFSIAWLKYFQFGPFEWLWRSLTYWKRQPMKRTTTMLAPGVAPVAI